MPSATIKIFLIYGDPKRLRTAELSNWNGKAVAGPRNEFDEVLKREESVNPGIYLLAGIDPESDKPALYIGEAECIRERLKTHSHHDLNRTIPLRDLLRIFGILGFAVARTYHLLDMPFATATPICIPIYSFGTMHLIVK
jgi:hypothetical protein